MKIAIDVVDLDVKDTNEQEISWLLMDALYEFQSNRIGKHGSARNYVANRYSPEVYSGERFDQKVKQVERRCDIAEKLRCGDISITE